MSAAGCPQRKFDAEKRISDGIGEIKMETTAGLGEEEVLGKAGQTEVTLKQVRDCRTTADTLNPCDVASDRKVKST